MLSIVRFCFPGVLPVLIGPRLLRPLFAVLRWVAPILTLGNRVVVTRYTDVVEVLTRDTDFTVSQINAPKIDQLDGPFILGMDRGPQYEREDAVLRAAVLPGDLARIGSFVATEAAGLIEAARPRGRIDVVNEYARVVAVRLVGSYFGMPGPTEAAMMGWLRDIFYDVFLNLTNDKTVHAKALASGNALRAHMNAVIAQRNAAAPADTPPDDVLGRLLAERGPDKPWLDDAAVRRNLSGLLVGAVETTSKFTVLALGELLKRPEQLARARAAALAGDVATVKRYAYEAARFNPHTPLLFRYAAHDTVLAAGKPREHAIKAGTTVLLGNISAMFDFEGFRKPGTFRIDHDSEMLHFGYGLHRCFGVAINGVQIPELMAALLRLPNLRLASGKDGCVPYYGPFPTRMLLEFDR